MADYEDSDEKVKEEKKKQGRSTSTTFSDAKYVCHRLLSSSPEDTPLLLFTFRELNPRTNSQTLIKFAIKSMMRSDYCKAVDLLESLGILSGIYYRLFLYNTYKRKKSISAFLKTPNLFIKFM